MKDSEIEEDDNQTDKVEESGKAFQLTLPKNWVFIPIPTNKNKNLGVYLNTHTKIMSLTCPFEYAQLPSMYKHFFNEPLCSNSNDILKSIIESTQPKSKPVKKIAKKISNKSPQKIPPIEEKQPLIQNSKRNNCGLLQSFEGPRKIQKTYEESFISKKGEEEPLTHCQSVRLKDFKMKTNDPISLFIQLCECVLKSRPEFEFEACGLQHKCIVKISKLNYINHEIASKKKKAKYDACIKTLKEVFSKAYSDWKDRTTLDEEAVSRIKRINKMSMKLQENLVQQEKNDTKDDFEKCIPSNESTISDQIESLMQNESSERNQNIEAESTIQEGPNIKPGSMPENKKSTEKNQSSVCDQSMDISEACVNEEIIEVDLISYSEQSMEKSRNSEQIQIQCQNNKNTNEEKISEQQDNTHQDFLSQSDLSLIVYHSIEQSQDISSSTDQSQVIFIPPIHNELVQIKDENLIYYSELLKETTPQLLLEKCITCMTGVEIVSEILSKSSTSYFLSLKLKHKRHFRFQVDAEKSNEITTTFNAHQILLSMLFGDIMSWLELVKLSRNFDPLAKRSASKTRRYLMHLVRTPAIPRLREDIPIYDEQVEEPERGGRSEQAKEPEKIQERVKEEGKEEKKQKEQIESIEPIEWDESIDLKELDMLCGIQRPDFFDEFDRSFDTNLTNDYQSIYEISD